MRATAMTPRRSLARRFVRQVARDCSTIACDAGTGATSLHIGRATLQILSRPIILKFQSWPRRARSKSANYRHHRGMNDLGDELIESIDLSFWRVPERL